MSDSPDNATLTLSGMPTSASREDPRWLGRYALLERLGAGGVGIVYKAYDPELDRAVALKVLRRGGSDSDDRARFQREAQAVARLRHPHVVTVYDIGDCDGEPYIAMELMNGGSLAAWLKSQARSPDEIVDVMYKAGLGLAAAHAEGIVHRDFKPANVLLDEDGSVRVADFGLARSVAAGELGSGKLDDREELASWPSPLVETITQTGTVLGTPAYMAPEQFTGGTVDARTDQYAFGVSLYEAFVGRRPPGAREAAGLDLRLDSRDIPARVQRVIRRSLAVNADDRFETMDELLRALAPPRRRAPSRLSVAIVLLLAVVGTWLVTAYVQRSRLHSEVDAHVRAAERLRATATKQTAAAGQERDRAIALFTTGKRRKGDEQWDRWLSGAEAAERQWWQAAREVEAALTRAPDNGNAVALSVEITRARIELARDRGQHELERELLARLRTMAGGAEALEALEPRGRLRVVAADPRIEQTMVYRYRENPGGAWSLDVVEVPEDGELLAGSYVVVGSAGDRELARTPVWVGHGEAREIELRAPTPLPDDMVLVHEGRFWAGLAVDETVRRRVLLRPPPHLRASTAYLIARCEVSFAAWLEFLDDLAARGEAPPAIEVDESSRGTSVTLAREDGNWTLAMQTMIRGVDARLGAGDPLVYPDRGVFAKQRWERLPVVGISANDAQRYLKWLRESGRVPGARLCTDDEWQRAARGADARRYPTGNEIGSRFENIDETFGRQWQGMGPTEVGSFPQGASPYGLLDMAGNAMEIVSSPRGVQANGGMWYGSALYSTVVSWQLFPEAQRSPFVGLRVCADYDGPVSIERDWNESTPH